MYSAIFVRRRLSGRWTEVPTDEPRETGAAALSFGSRHRRICHCIRPMRKVARDWKRSVNAPPHMPSTVFFSAEARE